LSFSAWTLQIDEEASSLQVNISLVALASLLGLYHKIFTDSINWVHRQLQEEPPSFSEFIAYAIATLFSTIVFVGLYLLVFNVFF